MTETPYHPARYWTDRFRKRLDLDATGYHGLGVGMNQWIYRRRRAAVRRLLQKHDVRVRGAMVAEMGVGTGYWIEEWHRLGAAHVLGVDITAVAVETLAQRYPEYRFVQADIGTPDAVAGLAPRDGFDLVVAMEVLLHITDSSQFQVALNTMARLTKPGGYVLLSDLFLSREVTAYHQVSRTLDEYQGAMSRHGFRLVDRVPVFFLLHPSEFEKHGVWRWTARQRWRLIAKSLHLMPALGWLLGAPLYVVDSVAALATRQGPSTHLTLWQRSPLWQDGYHGRATDRAR